MNFYFLKIWQLDHIEEAYIQPAIVVADAATRHSVWSSIKLGLLKILLLELWGTGQKLKKLCNTEVLTCSVLKGEMPLLYLQCVASSCVGVTKF